ncbi:MAG: HAD family phosphatase [Planctomycetes bacterium]|nr:HAD family phosphatase [Planctomycetota bacterium]MBL7144365.1 HAD family phosphatase [Phycisphaerae bacterium]
MEVIESVIFDWGGVLIEDPSPGIVKYCSEALAVSKEDYIKAHRKFIEDFEKSVISEEKFWERICNELGVSKPKVPSLWADAFKAGYVPREEVFSLAAGLRKKGYKTAFLSNTEEPSMRYFHQFGYDMFDVLVFSCAEGTRKPESRIYELTVQRLGSEAGQSVFIDDKPEYISGAQQAGLHAILFENVSQVKNELIMLGVE